MMTDCHEPDTARYRVEHHHDRGVTILGWLASGRPHHSTLDPYVSRLVRDGTEGLVVLVDLASGTRAAQRVVRMPRPSSRPPARQRGVSLHL